MKFVTIKDIARELALSISTVSRALNDDPNIRQETKDRIVTTAKRMGYMKSPVAMNLKFGYTKTIGVIVPEMATPYASYVIDGIQNVCYNNRYKVIVSSSSESPEKERRSIEIMYQFMGDGIIACQCENRQNKDCFQDLIDKNIPLVIFDRISAELNVPHILIDDETKAFFLVGHLIEQGHKRIAFIGINSGVVYNSWLRYQGYKEALERHDIALDKSIVFEASGMKYSDGAIVADQLIDKDIDAVFAFTDTLAIGVMNRLKSFGRRIPQDIAVAGFSGTELSTIVSPQLTTVEPPGYQMGQCAANTILDMIAKKEVKKRIVLDADIIYRESTEGYVK